MNKFIATVILGLLIAGSSLAEERDAKFYQKQFTHFSQVIADLKDSDVSGEATKEIELIRTAINQAQIHLGNEDLEKIEPLLTEITTHAEYASAKMNRARAEEAAEDAEAQASATEEQARKTHAEAEAAATKLKELEAKGL